MTDLNDLEALATTMRLWRQHIHRHPETAYEEHQTAGFIVARLQELGLQIESGIAETGIVASLQVGSGNKKIALRADIDALPITEQNTFNHKSINPGKMHACGHDGHTAILLGAASYLTKNRSFNGTVYFIFQPAEEGGAGARRMIDEGLFERFPADQVYALHNFPDVPEGNFAITGAGGPVMASYDCFSIKLRGRATHAAMPHLGSDVIVAGGLLINQLQTIVSRNINPGDPAVVSVTQIHAGNTLNAIPDEILLQGTLRCFKKDVQQLIKNRIEQLTLSLASSFELQGEVLFNKDNPGYPVTINTSVEAQIAAEVAIELVGEEKVDLTPTPSMGAEDFSYMLQEKPGCYLWIGNGSQHGDCLLHNPKYDFNDNILSLGAAFWVKLVEKILQ